MPLLYQAPQGLYTVFRAKHESCHTAHEQPPGPGPSLLSSFMPHHTPHMLLNPLSPPPPILSLSLCLCISSPHWSVLSPPLCLPNWNLNFSRVLLPPGSLPWPLPMPKSGLYLPPLGCDRAQGWSWSWDSSRSIVCFLLPAVSSLRAWAGT